MNYNVLTSEIKNGVTRGLYLFYGPEEYLIRHYIEELKKIVVEPSMGDISVSYFEDRFDLAAVGDACTMYPMFGERRLVILKNCGLLKQIANAGESGARGKARIGEPGIGGSGRKPAKTVRKSRGQETDDNAHNATESLIDNLPDFTCLLIVEREVDKRRPLFGIIQNKGLAVEFEYRTPRELESWVTAIARRDGMNFTYDALKWFMENAGTSMTEIRSELDKLLAYSFGKTSITLRDVNDVCCITLKNKIFDLLDYIVTGKNKLAVAELEALLLEREPAVKILSMLSGHLMLLGHIKSLASSGIKLDQAVDILGINRYRAEKMWRQCRSVTPSRISDAIRQCHERDIAIKGGKTGDVAALRLLVASIANIN